MEDAILILEASGIGSDFWPWGLKFKMVEMKIHSIIVNISWVYTHSLNDILILMFCTSLGH